MFNDFLLFSSEFLKDDKNIFEYNCDRKEEFIKKGVVRSRTKGNEGWFAKFPKDIVLCEEMTGGDTKILQKEPFVERKEQRTDYNQIFGKGQEKKNTKKKVGKTLKNGLFCRKNPF